MRLICKIPSHPVYKRLMLYRIEQGILLFFYKTDKDANCERDEFFDDLEEAYQYVKDKFGVSPSDWARIDDPHPGCQHDFISPVRVKGREIGSPEWGVFERLENGVWVEYFPDN